MLIESCSLLDHKIKDDSPTYKECSKCGVMVQLCSHKNFVRRRSGTEYYKICVACQRVKKDSEF